MTLWCRLCQVRTWADFYDWLETTLVPGLRADVWYNGDQPIFQRGFVGDRVSRIMGYATLRQQRVQEGDTTAVVLMDMS